MCTRGSLPLAAMSEPEIGEKHSSISTDEAAESPHTGEISEKTGLPLTPSPDLECLAPGYEPKHLQRILRESILLGTGGVAILLQMAHPGVSAGVDVNSNFAYRPIDRLRTTMTYMYTMAFGTAKEKAAIIEMVHRAHVPVQGPGYSADDPDLQLWVASTLYTAGVHIHHIMFGKMDDTTEDQLYQEYSVMATSLRVPRDMWPETRKEFWEYWDEKIETLHISENAKNVCNDLLYNKNGPLWFRVNLPLLRVVTAEWLPPRMREEYGLKKHPKSYKTMLLLMKSTYPILPPFIRHYPLNYYLADMRKRMKKANRII